MLQKERKSKVKQNNNFFYHLTFLHLNFFFYKMKLKRGKYFPFYRKEEMKWTKVCHVHGQRKGLNKRLRYQLGLLVTSNTDKSRQKRIYGKLMGWHTGMQGSLENQIWRWTRIKEGYIARTTGKIPLQSRVTTEHACPGPGPEWKIGYHWWRGCYWKGHG